MTDDSGGHPGDQPTPLDKAVWLTDPGQLIVATPYLLGFHPADSIVLCAVKDGGLEYTLRTDCPTDPALYPVLARTLVGEIHQPDGIRVAAVIVGTPAEDHILARHLLKKFTEAGIPINVFGVPAIVHGARWIDYDDAEHSGDLPDPTTSIVAANAVARGLVTLPSREALVAQLAPAPEDVLARRAALLQASDDEPQRAELTTDERVEWLRRHYVDRVADGDEDFSDNDIVLACRMLTERAVRDRCLSLLSGPQAASAERLWTILARQCPPPACAEPAVLLAMSAYIRGDGALAAIAVDRALTARPRHLLAHLLGRALNAGIHPRQIRKLITSLTDQIV